MRAGILVTASPYTATTAEDGSFSISNVRPGQYNLTIYAGRHAGRAADRSEKRAD